MAEIKKLTDGSGSQYFPQTHTKAVIDDQGNSVESVLQAQTDIINAKQFEQGDVEWDIYPTADSYGKVASSGGIKDALDNKVDMVNIMQSHSWDLSDGGDFVWFLGTIHADGLAYSSSSYYHVNIPVNAGMPIKLKANSSHETTYAFLKDVDFSYPVGGTDITSHYADGHIGVYTIAADNEKTFSIPEGCNYLYITMGQQSGSVYKPAENYYYTPKWDEDINALAEKAIPRVPLSTVFTNDYGVEYDTGELVYNRYFAYSEYIDVHAYDVVNIGVFEASPSSGYALYDENKQYISGGHGSGQSWKYTNTDIDTSEAYYLRLTSVSQTDSHFAEMGYPHVVAVSNVIVANNLDVTDAGYVLDARQGKVLLDVIKTGELMIDTSTFTWTLGYITTSGTAGADDSYHITQYSNYIELDKNFSKIVTSWLKGSSARVGAFYDSSKSFISYFGNTVVTEHGYENGHVVDIPNDAVYVRLTRYTDTSTYGQIQFGYKTNVGSEDSNYLANVSVFRNAKVISQSNYKFAFCAHSFIFDNSLYVTYWASTNTNGDNHDGSNTCMLDSYSLFDKSVTNTIQTVAGFQDSSGNAIDVTKIYVGPTIVNDTITSYVQAWKPNVNNPYVGYIRASSPNGLVGGTVVACNLSYNSNTVLFNMQNYRQMLADVGYASSYVAPEQAIVDNNGICYYGSTYYMVFNSNSIHNTKLPLVLLTSSDGVTWSPVSTIGDGVYAGSEISIACKDSKLYIASRDETHGIDWFVFDLTNNTVLKSGNFGTWPICSRPYTFMFHTDVYMAVNVSPTIYGAFTGATYITTDARDEVNIYKMVNDEPKLFRKVNNPEGINYHTWTPSPIVGSMYAQQSIYSAYSEDRRHLFRRQFGNVSVADVTALFTDL